jgi:hypothetical protein
MVQAEEGLDGDVASVKAASSLDARDPVAIPAKSNQLRIPPAFWLVLVGGACLLCGWWLSRLVQPPPKRHRPEERDAILAKMRKWLAEGGDTA